MVCVFQKCCLAEFSWVGWYREKYSYLQGSGASLNPSVFLLGLRRAVGWTCSVALSARPVHSKVSSDSITMIEVRVWSQTANSSALWGVLLFGLGLEKPTWGCWQATSQTCLFIFSVAMHSKGGVQPGQVEIMNRCRSSQDQLYFFVQGSSQTVEELFPFWMLNSFHIANKTCVVVVSSLLSVPCPWIFSLLSLWFCGQF